VGIAVLLVAMSVPFWPRWNLNLVAIAPPASTATQTKRLQANPLQPESPLDPARSQHVQNIDAKSGDFADHKVLLSRLYRSSRKAPRIVTNAFQRVNRRSPKKPNVDLRVSESLDEPVAFGLFPPVIILPESLAKEGESAACQAALSHEWEHIMRGDLWYLALCRWLTIVLFANPLYWWLRRQLNRDQELLADAAVTHMTPVDYAALLVQWSRNRSHGLFGNNIHNQVVMFGGGELKRRVAQLLAPKNDIEPSPPVQWSGGWTIALATGIAAISLFSNGDFNGSTQLPSSPLAHSAIVTSIRPPTNIVPTTLNSQSPENLANANGLVFTISENTSLELVAMRLHPCDGETWWQLDGTASLNCDATSSDARYFPPEVVIRISSEDDIAPEWVPDPLYSRPLDENDLAIGEAKGGRLYAVSLPADAKDFELQLTRGEWRMRSLSTCSNYFQHDPFQYSPCDESDKLIVSVQHPVLNEQLRLVAMDGDGFEHDPVELSDTDGELTAVFSELTYDQAQSFYVQSRPKLSVGLQNLPLLPGQQTDFQVVARNGHHARQENEL
jgi:hypothetical protein